MPSNKLNFTSFLVEKRGMMLVFMLLLFVGCGLLIPHVNINTDMTKYLPLDSPMKQGLDKMSQAFPEMDMNTFSVRAMYRDLDSVQRGHLADSLKSLDGVAMLTSVQDHAPYTLFELSMLPDSDPKQLASDIKGSGRDVIVETSIDGNLPDVIVFIIAGVLVFSILFLMCRSWVEPLLFLATIGIAVIINVGSNALLPSVSMTTNAIVAILQLVLSMDYSIILSNRFYQEKKLNNDTKDAMRMALCKATPSVLSSAFTTIVGLLMLCFMKFRIGLDLGIVLAKGVLCSILCLYTVLPALMLSCNKAVEKSQKRIFLPKTDRLAKWEYRWRIPLAVATVVICFGAYFLHNLTPITFSTNWPTDISDVFPRKNTIVMLYNNNDEDKIIAWADSLSKDPLVDTVVSYPTLLMRQQSPDEMASSLEGLLPMMPPETAEMVQQYLTPDMLSLVFQMLNEKHDEGSQNLEEEDLRVEDGWESGFTVAAQGCESHSTMESTTPEETVIEEMDSSLVAHPEGIDSALSSSTPSLDVPTQHFEHSPLPSYYDTIHTPMNSVAIAGYLGFKSRQAATLFKMAKRSTMTPIEFVRFVTSSILPNKLYASFVSEQQRSQLLALQHKMEEATAKHNAEQEALASQAQAPASEDDDSLMYQETPSTPTPLTQQENPSIPQPLSKPEPLQVLDELEKVAINSPLQSTKIVRSLPKSAINTPLEDSCTASIAQLLNYITHDLVNDPELGAFIPDSLRSQLGSTQKMMDEGLGQIRGNGYSIAAIVTSYPDEGKSVQVFLKDLRNRCDDSFDQDYSLIGESVMFEEMRQGFNHELLIVTLLTIFSIYIIVALTFHSLVLPLMLIVTVLSGVYINVYVSGLGGNGILYLAYLIVQSILMGATIDYAILFANYYREKRQSLDIPHALQEAYKGSIHTITTSGLIIVCAPGAMALLVEDRTISMIVSCLAVGGASAITLILFVLPGAMAALDHFVIKKQRKTSDEL